MLISAKNNLVFIVLTILGSLLASEGNNARGLLQPTISEGNQGVPASSDEVRDLLLSALSEASQQFTQEVAVENASLEQPLISLLLPERRPRSVTLLHTPEFLGDCSLATAVAAQDIAAIQVALDRGELPSATMLIQDDLDQAIIDLLWSYLPALHE